MLVNYVSSWRRPVAYSVLAAMIVTVSTAANASEVAHHEGGYTAFDVDVTDALTGSGEEELVVRATDLTEQAPFPVGKQRSEPGGILYTPSSGIWQTVWAEPVPDAHVTALGL